MSELEPLFRRIETTYEDQGMEAAMALVDHLCTGHPAAADNLIGFLLALSCDDEPLPEGLGEMAVRNTMALLGADHAAYMAEKGFAVQSSGLAVEMPGQHTALKRTQAAMRAAALLDATHRDAWTVRRETRDPGAEVTVGFQVMLHHDYGETGHVQELASGLTADLAIISAARRLTEGAQHVE